MRVLRKLFLLLIVAAGAIGWDARQNLTAPLAVAQPTRVEAPKGASFARMVQQWSAQGVFANWRQAEYLRWYARATGGAQQIRAGEYLVTPGMTPAGLLELVLSGRVYLHQLTIVEGWTATYLLEQVRAHPALIQTLGGAPPEAVMTQLGAAGVHPEGRFLPETYSFPKGTTDLAYLKRAYDAMARALADEWAVRQPDLPLKTPDEALVLASIIERETGVPVERPAIGGVFVRRLQRGMLLQTDPTVIYGMGAAFTGNLRRADLETDNPYNTYMRPGLPPTPIALPGRAALHAAIQPEPGETLYLVAKGDGSHHFSATLEEHVAAVARYQLRRNP